MEPEEHHGIAHYYGDIIRILFFTVAVMSLVSTPLIGDLVPMDTLSLIVSSVVLVALAALTNPRSRSILIIDTIVSMLGVILLELSAMTRYASDPFVLLVARECASFLLLLAFYFSTKTVRAMMQHTMGHSVEEEFVENEE